MVGIDDETVIVGSCSSVDFSRHAFEIFKFAVKTYFIIDSTFKLGRHKWKRKLIKKC